MLLENENLEMLWKSWCSGNTRQDLDDVFANHMKETEREEEDASIYDWNSSWFRYLQFF